MKREHDLRLRLAALETLGEAIGAMKNLSAHHFRQLRNAVAPAARYREGVELIADESGAVLAGGTGGAALLLIGGQLGLCGSYNVELARTLAQRRKELGEGLTYCVGKRATRLALRLGLPLDRTYAAPTNSSAIGALVLELSQDLLEDYRTKNLSRLEVVSSGFEGVGSHHPKTTLLLPMRRGKAGASLRSPYVSQEYLSQVAVRELFYCTLYDLLIEGFAAEHGARLLATQAAEQWLNATAKRLRQRLTAAGREASTQEVIEIGAGARANHSFG